MFPEFRLGALAAGPIVACTICGCASSVSTAPRTPDQDSAEAAVVATFTAMRERDCEALRALVEPGARIYRLGHDGSIAVIEDPDFVQGICQGDHVIDERIIAPTRVDIDGDLASVWAPYDVRIDGEYHHAGVDAVHLRRVGSGWRVLAISYTDDGGAASSAD